MFAKRALEEFSAKLGSAERGDAINKFLSLTHLNLTRKQFTEWCESEQICSWVIKQDDAKEEQVLGSIIKLTKHIYKIIVRNVFLA